MTYTNKTCVIYWQGDKHTRIVIIAIKSRSSAVISSFQDFEQEISVKTNFSLLVSMINSKHVYFYWGSFTLWTPQCIFLGGSGPPQPPRESTRLSKRCWNRHRCMEGCNRKTCLVTALNENRRYLLQLCCSNGLRILNTFF